MTTIVIAIAAVIVSALGLAGAWRVTDYLRDARAEPEEPTGLGDEPTDPSPPPAIERPEPRDHLEDHANDPPPPLSDDPADVRARHRARRRRRAILEAERRYRDD